MKKKLVLLEQLQALDSAVDEKKVEQATHHNGIIALDQNLEQIRAALATHQARMAELEREKGELETALQAEQDNVKRSESHMKEIRTNKEYQAVGREIAAARKQIGELEEQALQKGAQIEELQGTLSTCSAELATQEEQADGTRATHQQAIQTLQTDIDAALAKRDEIVKGLASSVLRRYSQLREQRRGQALAEAKDGSCLGCNMHLPPQLYNTLFKGEELHFCPHCQRILYLRQEETQA